MATSSACESALALRKARRGDLMSPEKIFWAVSWLKSTTRGRDSPAMKEATASSVIPSDKTARPSSKVFSRSTASHLELLCHSALLSSIHLGQHNLGFLLGEN